jgi:hypothetical protein
MIYQRGFWILIPCIIGAYQHIGEHDFSILRVKVLGPCLTPECMQLVLSNVCILLYIKTQQIKVNNKCVPLMSASFRIFRERKTLSAAPNTKATEAVIGSIAKLSVVACAWKV